MEPRVGFGGNQKHPPYTYSVEGSRNGLMAVTAIEEFMISGNGVSAEICGYTIR
jgi:hypothetical protein